MESLAQTELEVIAQAPDNSQELDLEAYGEAYNAIADMAAETINYEEEDE